MPDAPQDYNICPCCGTEFGNDDEQRTTAELRSYWVSTGAKWFYKDAPAMWNPWFQLVMAGVKLPYPTTVSVIGYGANSSACAKSSSKNKQKSKQDDFYPYLAEAA